jgi:integrase
MAHVQRKVRSDGTVRYEVRWTERVRDAAGHTQTVRHRQKSFTRAKAANAFKPLHEADTLRGDLRDYDAAALPFSHYADNWMRALRTQVKARTIEGYEQALHTHVLPAFGERSVGSIAPADVREFVAALVRRKLSASSIKATVGCLRRILDLAIEDTAIRFNPTHSVRLPSDRQMGRERFQPVFLTEDQVATLTDQFSAPYALMVRFLAWTGLRKGELAGLDVGDVHLWRTKDGWRGYVDVHRTRRKITGGWEVGTPKSEQSTRRVSLQDWLAEDMHTYIATQHGNPVPAAPLWPNRQRGGYTHGTRANPDGPRHGALDWSTPIEPGAFFRNLFKPALISAKLPPATRLHDLRHTYAALALSRGASPYWVSEQMGHSSYKITLDVYAHYIPKDEAHQLNGRPVGPSAPVRASLGQ